MKTFKICSLGDTGAGKTSLINVIKNQNYLKKEDYKNNFDYLKVKSTIGMDYHSCMISHQRIEFWDTAGEERYRALASFYLRNCQIILLVFDITTFSLLEDLEYWKKFIDDNNNDAKIFIIINKIDLKSVTQEYRMIRDTFRDRETDIEIFETSVLNNSGIEKIVNQIKKIIPRPVRSLDYQDTLITLDVKNQRPFCC